MPWPTGQSFASRHNKKLRGAAASTAARVATALISKGKDEGTAIRIANAIGNRAQGVGARFPTFGYLGTGFNSNDPSFDRPPRPGSGRDSNVIMPNTTTPSSYQNI
jgi:hypothetical protein